MPVGDLTPVITNVSQTNFTVATTTTGVEFKGINVYLGRRSQQSSAVESQQSVPLPMNLTRIASLEGQSLSAERERIFPSAQHKPIVLYVFSPECQWCAKNSASLSALAGRERASYDFVAISMSPVSPEGFLKDHPLDVPVVWNVGGMVEVPFRISATPTTVVVAPDGRVKQMWPGIYTGSTKTAIERYFGVNLNAK